MANVAAEEPQGHILVEIVPPPQAHRAQADRTDRAALDPGLMMFEMPELRNRAQRARESTTSLQPEHSSIDPSPSLTPATTHDPDENNGILNNTN